MNDPFNPQSSDAPGDGQDSWQEVMGGFPRHLTTQLIEDGSVEQARKEKLAGALVGLALALFALAWPQERLLSTIPTGSLQGISAAGVGWTSLAERLAPYLGVTPEVLGLLAAALAYGLCLPLALSIARQLGIAFRVALPTCLVVLLSPGVWSAATTPAPGTLALLLGLLIMGELWRPDGQRRALVFGLWVACAALDVGMAWALPALLWTGMRRNHPSPRGILWPGRLLLCVCLALVLGALASFGRNVSWSSVLIQGYLFGLGGSWSSPLTWAAATPATLGLALVGLASLFFLRRNEAEAAPPRWLLLWCLLPALVCALGGPAPLGFSYIWLIPPALIGCLDLVARQDERAGPLWAVLGLVAQALVLAGVLSLLDSTDPSHRWRARASEQLERSDWVLTDDRGHLFLLRDRWGLEAEFVGSDADLDDLLDQTQLERLSGRRVVLDLDPASPLRASLPGLFNLRRGNEGR